MHVHAEGQRGVPAGKAALRDDEVVQRDDAQPAQLFRDRSQEVAALLDRVEAFEREARFAVVPAACGAISAASSSASAARRAPVSVLAVSSRDISSPSWSRGRKPSGMPGGGRRGPRPRGDARAKRRVRAKGCGRRRRSPRAARSRDARARRGRRGRRELGDDRGTSARRRGAVAGDGLLAVGEDADAEAPGSLDRARAGRRGAERDEHQRRIGRDGGERGHRQAPGAAADAARHEDDTARERAHRLGELGSRHGRSAPAP